MNVLYVGNYRHPWCTEVHVTRDLERLGVFVQRFQEPPGGGTLDTLSDIERDALAYDIDVVFWQRTWGLPHRETTQLWRNLEAQGIKTASYHLDLYVGLARQRKVKGDPFWTTGTVFTPDGGLASEEWFKAQGINHVWSPPAVVSDELADVMPGSHRDEYDFDVVFVGSAPEHYHPEWTWRREMLDALKARYGDRFARFGGDTPGGPVRGQDLNDLYATARVVVGDSCFARWDQWYWSDRPMETIGRGGNLLFPHIELLERMLGPYPNYQVGDVKNLLLTVDWMLERPEPRAWIAPTIQRIREEHTYVQRMERALRVLS
jgi:hypothetical protein